MVRARCYMSLGSLMAGLALNNAGTSLVQAMAYPIGGEFHVSHGKSLTGLILSCFSYIMPARQEKFIRVADHGRKGRRSFTKRSFA
ncbi:MAG: hypothetical protein DRP87_09030 [Spirochaetes bacterium]|nr:MAG: hypothetical protein DRP87_09030 [Spirochaetota bacterium]